jgi:NO-binding membrane sensor protein with MHYT domain
MQWKNVLAFCTKLFLYSIIIILIDFLLILAFTRVTNDIVQILSFVMLIEGGIVLILGGVTASYSSIYAKLSEVVFHTEPWNAKRQKEVEINARAWIIVGIILVIEALVLSAF